MKIPLLSSLSHAFGNNAAAAPKPAATVPVPTPAVDGRAEAIVEGICKEMPDLLIVVVVDTASGRDMASFAHHTTITPHMAAELNSVVVKQKQRILKAFLLPDEVIEDIIVSTTSQYHLIKAVNNGAQFLYLAVDADKTGLGFAREVLRRYALALVE